MKAPTTVGAILTQELIPEAYAQRPGNSIRYDGTSSVTSMLRCGSVQYSGVPSQAV
ncbi:MAG TPA: hypothetical protein VGV09_02930 [Steroidobacteraceae bacterium]|nr:hypothetical protein [Steroidobacteraceae bacterium]